MDWDGGGVIGRPPPSAGAEESETASGVTGDLGKPFSEAEKEEDAFGKAHSDCEGDGIHVVG